MISIKIVTEYSDQPYTTLVDGDHAVIKMVQPGVISIAVLPDKVPDGIIPETGGPTPDWCECGSTRYGLVCRQQANHDGDHYGSDGTVGQRW